MGGDRVGQADAARDCGGGRHREIMERARVALQVIVKAVEDPQARLNATGIAYVAPASTRHRAMRIWMPRGPPRMRYTCAL
jgi:hypothetical protein